MKEWLRHLLTGADNKTPDFLRHLGLIGGLAGIALTGFDVVAHSAHFNWSDFGTGFGLFGAGIGVGVGAKAHTEPKPED